MTPYGTIVADPPWHYGDRATMPGDSRKTGHEMKRPDMPYPTMTVEEIAALPVASLAARDCFLFCWTTNKYLPATFDVLRAWGFAYRQTLVWHKTGNPSPFGGSVAPNHAEFLLLAAKGSPKLTADRWKSSVVSVPKPYKHSLKPEAFLDLIESCCPGPFLELFARRQRFGWDVWGDEVATPISLEAA